MEEMLESVEICRQTVWKEMVERERRKGDVRVESAKTEQQTWWSRLREPLVLLFSIAVFVALLGKLGDEARSKGRTRTLRLS